MITEVDPRHRYDVLVIGAGLTGGWAAKELAEAGLEVLVLDAGPWLEPHDVASVEPRSSPRRREAARRQPVQSQTLAYWMYHPNLFVDDFDHPYAVVAHSPFAWIRGRQVGGRSLTWGGATLRLSDYEFRDPDRDGVGPRWPIGYADLAPYYDTVERVLGVAGSAEGLPQLPDGVFLPPAPFTRTERAFKTAVEAQCPIIPIAIIGTREILPAYSWLPRRGAVSVIIGAPIKPEGSDWQEMVRLRDQVRSEISRLSGERGSR